MNLWKRISFSLLAVVCFTSGFAQCKTYQIGEKGDTLNCTDMSDRKKGKWVVRAESLRGNPGYEEEGVYEEDRKEGIWRRYSLMGDLMAVENYKWGLKDGRQQYFTVAGIEREEHWRSINPNQAFDTIEVMSLTDQNTYEKVIVKNEGRSKKHGAFRYFRPGTGVLLRQENFYLDKPFDPKNGIPGQLPPGVEAPVTEAAGGDSTATAKPKEKPKPQAVADWEKKNSGKKSIKVRGGNTGM